MAAAGSPFAAGIGAESVKPWETSTATVSPDLVTANYAGNDVTVLLGNGSGGFTEAAGSPFVAGTHPRNAAIGDFNGDGIQDLAVSNQGTNNITVLLGNGAGGFTAAAGSPFATGTNPQFLVLGDFNADGIQDLAVANNGTAIDGSANLTVLLGNGAGGFTAAAGSPFAVGANPESTVVGDFNGDGFQDLKLLGVRVATT